jgi:ribonuclease P protein component
MQRRHRLVQSKRFQQVYRQGRSLVHPLLVLRALGNGLPYSRFGFVVGKRLGGAVVRNAVKRKMREATRARITAVPLGWDVILIARTPIVGASFWCVGEALDRLLPRLNQLPGTQSDPLPNSQNSPDVAR